MAKKLSLFPSLRHVLTLIAKAHDSGRFLIGKQILLFYLIKLFWHKAY